MPTGNNQRPAAPFGYTFDIPNLSNNSTSYPAPGPPLLDNNESGILDNFFKDPNNVDPNFLSVPADFQGDPSALFGGNSLDWLAALSQTPDNSRSLSQTIPARPNNNLYNRGEHAQSVPATEDVYAAARLLHNNQGRFGNMSGQYNGYPNMSNGSHDMSASNGFYPPIPSPHNTPYHFGAPSAGNTIYNMSDFHSQFNGGSQNPGQAVDSRNSAMRFGADNNFRNSYSSTAQDLQDKETQDGFAQLYQVAREHQASLGEAPTAVMESSGLKRSRAAVDSKDVTRDSEDYQSSEEEAKASKKRRKGKAKDDDEDDFEDSGVNGRRKSSSVKAKARINPTDTPNSSKKTKTTVDASKSQRENLSEEQKRNNHIQSEQKRRNLIKQGFEDLNKLVPELRTGGLSKSNMLVETARYMKRLQEENDELRAHLRSVDAG